MSESETAKSGNQGRIILSENVPLKKPLVIRINPSSACNLRCQFCPMTTKAYKEKHKVELMPLDLFKEIIDDIKESFVKVKNIKMAGMGEPLTHPQFSEMVKYAVEKDVCDVIETITNAALLTHEMSDGLIDSGLSLIRISINGLNDEDYLKHCDAKVSFDNMVEQICYLYEHKTNLKIYLKIINYMVANEEKRKFFFDTFEPICDIINIENLIENDESGEIQYKEFGGDNFQTDSTSLNLPVNKQSEICTMPFFNMRICTDGGVTPCCFEEKEIYIANRKNKSLREIWEEDFFKFQRQMLEGVETTCEFCRNCTNYQSMAQPEDSLDEKAEEIKIRYDLK